METQKTAVSKDLKNGAHAHKSVSSLALQNIVNAVKKANGVMVLLVWSIAANLHLLNAVRTTLKNVKMRLLSPKSKLTNHGDAPIAALLKLQDAPRLIPASQKSNAVKSIAINATMPLSTKTKNVLKNAQTSHAPINHAALTHTFGVHSKVK